MPFTVYYKKECGYSRAALTLLEKRKLPHVAHEVNSIGGKDRVIQALRANRFIPKRAVHDTVPIVFDPKNGFIGGYTELKRYVAKM